MMLMRQSDGCAPLHLATASGRTAMVAALLKSGADVNQTVTVGS